MTNSWSKTCPPHRNMPKATTIESLPDELIFEILVRVPAQDLYDSTRLVCREWYNMIQTRNFAHSHFQRSTPGHLIVGWFKREQTFITMQKGRIEMSKLNYGFNHIVLTSCNGLLLEKRHGNLNLNELYIANPVTKQRFALPPFISGKETDREMLSLAYVDSSRAYKVVRVSYSSRDSNDLVCAIMTVGVDTDWTRRVSTQHLSLKAKELLYEFPLTTRGFFHWVRNGISEYVLTMNVESEIITQIPGPCLRNDGRYVRCSYLPMGSYLSMFIDRDEFSWEVWKMKPETGEWTKMLNIDLEPQKLPKHLSSKSRLQPVGWSNSREVFFYGICFIDSPSGTRMSIAYNVGTREMDSGKLKTCPSSFLNHIGSLLWLD
ncbi:hypothetical protein CASFOL_041226 [Castilleja foliolosa]|uniref:F-box domain-containing protein n=1 Tax=Castilleja foliolosa TaxID=1961234 RepID=A0ABD3BFI7_9LAMI